MASPKPQSTVHPRRTIPWTLSPLETEYSEFAETPSLYGPPIPENPGTPGYTPYLPPTGEFAPLINGEHPGPMMMFLDLSHRFFEPLRLPMSDTAEKFPLRSSELEQLAILPAVTRMTITCADIPWKITLGTERGLYTDIGNSQPANGQPITVHMVLFSIYRMLHQRVSRKEWSQFSTAQIEAAKAACAKRCGASSSTPPFEEDEELKRVDFLPMGKYIFMGLTRPPMRRDFKYVEFRTGSPEECGIEQQPEPLGQPGQLRAGYASPQLEERAPSEHEMQTIVSPLYLESAEFSDLDIRSMHTVSYNGMTFPSAYHLYHAFKFMDIDPDVVDRIRHCSDLTELESIVEQASSSIRPDWEHVIMLKVSVSCADHARYLIVESLYFQMIEAQYAKIDQYPHLRDLLLSTGDADLAYRQPTINALELSLGDENLETIATRALIRVRNRLRDDHIHTGPPGS